MGDRVSPTVEVTLDCADAPTLAAFWAIALGYVDISPDQAADRGYAWLHDPRSVGPHLCLLEVPEPKTVKEPGAMIRTWCATNVGGATCR